MDFRNAVTDIAEKYRSEGYNVIVKPSREQRPPFAVNEDVDILAYKGDEKVIVEVKISREDLRKDGAAGRMAEAVSSQPGWRFDLVVVNPDTGTDTPPREASEPPQARILHDLAYAEQTARAGDLSYSCVIAWASLEAAMRRAARSSGIEVKNYSPVFMLRTLYSNGLLEREEFDRLSGALRIRNAAVHGMELADIDPTMPQYIVSTARKLLSVNGQDGRS